MLPTPARWALRIGFIVLLLALWEAYAAITGDDWTSRPTLVAIRIFELARTDLASNVLTTLTEIAAGLLIGVPAGVVVAIALAEARTLSALLRPVIIAGNSVPIVALAPLLIMWFGLGLAPKIALVTLVSFFLLFFNTYAGVLAIDTDLVDALRLMGASRLEIFRKVTLPGVMTWVFSGLRSALPYSLIAATVGEMMLAQRGIGFLVSDAASSYDMTGVYAALVVLMIVGLCIDKLASCSESWILRWRRHA